MRAPLEPMQKQALERISQNIIKWIVRLNIAIRRLWAHSDQQGKPKLKTGSSYWQGFTYRASRLAYKVRHPNSVNINQCSIRFNRFGLNKLSNLATFAPNELATNGNWSAT